MTEQIRRVAELLRERDAIDAQLAAITDRPVVAGHLGEWIASQIFGIDLHADARQRGSDGIFAAEPFPVGRSVNIKWYGKHEGLLDMTRGGQDYYLVLTGPRSAAMSSKGGTRPLRIDSVFLFEADALHAAQDERGGKVGVAASVRREAWDAAEIFPARHERFPLTDKQRDLLLQFAN